MNINDLFWSGTKENLEEIKKELRKREEAIEQVYGDSLEALKYSETYRAIRKMRVSIGNMFHALDRINNHENQ